MREFYREFQNRAESLKPKIVFGFFEENYNLLKSEMKSFFKIEGDGIGRKWRCVKISV